MPLRKRIAALGMVLVCLHLSLNAAGISIPTEILPPLPTVPVTSPQNSIQETPSVTLATPVPSPASTVTPAPTVTPQILEAIIAGGIRVDNSTEYSIDTAQLLTEGPSITLQAGQPQILIIHTHSSEAYTMDDFDQYEPSDNSRTQDVNYNIIRVGDVLTEALRSHGLEVLHDREIYDYPSYTGSYTRCGEAINRYLAEYPSIAIVIDVHRDAIGSGDVVYKTVAEDVDTPCAQTMFVVGSNASGLEHPQWRENLKLALYLQASVHMKHPTLQRAIKLVKERYNQQLTTGSLILEVGSNGNTLQEAINAINFFAEGAGPALAKLIK